MFYLPIYPLLSLRVASSVSRFETGAEYLGTVPPPETVDSAHSFVGQLRCYSFARPSDGIEERVPQASVEPFRGEPELDSLKTPGLESWEIETVIFTSYRWQLGSPY